MSCPLSAHAYCGGLEEEEGAGELGRSEEEGALLAYLVRAGSMARAGSVLADAVTMEWKIGERKGRKVQLLWWPAILVYGCEELMVCMDWLQIASVWIWSSLSWLPKPPRNRTDRDWLTTVESGLPIMAKAENVPRSGESEFRKLYEYKYLLRTATLFLVL